MNVTSNMVRIATTKDGERFLVQQLDLERGVVHCWPAIEGYKPKDVKVDGSVTFARHEVTVAELAATNALWDNMFEQTRAKRKAALLAGDLIVVKTADTAKFVKAPKASIKHPRLACPCCNSAMRMRTLRTGASFFGCASWNETGCNARWTARDGWNLCGTNLEGSSLQGTEREGT